MKIDMTKKYKTRDGRNVRILCVDGPHKTYPVLGFVEGEVLSRSWMVDGKYDQAEARPYYDLVEVQDTKTVKLYVIVLNDSRIYTWDSYKDYYKALTLYKDELFATFDFEKEVEKGEGL